MSLQSYTFTFQDPSGQPLVAGKMTVRLSTDASAGGTGQVCNSLINVTLDTNGSATVFLWPNDQLIPTNTQYRIQAYTAKGELCYDEWITLVHNSPVYRGVTSLAFLTNHYVLAFPSGTQAGDLAIVFGGHTYAITSPSGWTVGNNTGSLPFWSGGTFYKVLTSGDIATGSVSINTALPGDGVCALITIARGTFSGVREVDYVQNSSGFSAVNVSTSSSIVGTDLLVYFGSNRALSTNTVNKGTLLNQTHIPSGSASACLAAGAGLSGTVTATFSYSSAGAGDYQAIACVKI